MVVHAGVERCSDRAHVEAHAASVDAPTRATVCAAPLALAAVPECACGDGDPVGFAPLVAAWVDLRGGPRNRAAHLAPSARSLVGHSG